MSFVTGEILDRVAKAIGAVLYRSHDIEAVWPVMTPAEQDRLREMAEAAVIEYVASVGDTGGPS